MTDSDKIRAELERRNREFYVENTSSIDETVFKKVESDKWIGVVWIGSLQECDLCHKEYPMSWIIWTGVQCLCYACYYPNWKLDKESVEKHKTLNL